MAKGQPVQPRDRSGRYYLLDIDPDVTEYNLLEVTRFTAEDGSGLPDAMECKYPWLGTNASVTAYVFNGDKPFHALDVQFQDMDSLAALTIDFRYYFSYEGDVGGLLGHVPLLQFLLKHSSIPDNNKSKYLTMLDRVIFGDSVRLEPD